MKKILILACFCLIMQYPGAGVCGDIVRGAGSAVDSKGSSTIPVGATQINFSKSFGTRNMVVTDDMGVMFKVTGVSPNIRIDFEQSYKPPASEGTEDTAYLITDNISTVTDTDWHMATVDSVEGTFGRFRLEGASGNGSANTVEIKYIK